MPPTTQPATPVLKPHVHLGLAQLVFGAMVAATLLISPAHAQVDWTVCAGGGCTYTTIQAAINAGLGPDVTIRVKAGTYRPTTEVDLDSLDSGTPGHPAILRAYGDGPVIIDCSDDYSGAEKWSVYSGNVFQADRDSIDMKATATEQTQVFVDTVRYTYVSASNYESLGNKQWRYDRTQDKIYINAGGTNPGSHSIFVGNWRRQYGLHVAHTSHLVIDGFTVLRASDVGIEVIGDTVINKLHSVTVKNCVVGQSYKQNILFKWTNGCTITNNVSYRSFDNGIQLVQSDHCDITHNTAFRNNKESAPYISGGKVGIKVGDSQTLAHITDVNVDYNTVFENQDSGIEVRGQRVAVRRNVSYRNGDHGYDNLYAQDVAHINNLAYQNDHDGISIESSASNVKIYNCILVHNAVNWETLNTNETYYVRELLVAGTTGFASNRNVIVGLGTADSATIYKRYLVDYAGVRHETLSSYQGTGKDPNSYSTIPEFNDASTYDFTIKDTATNDNIVDAGESIISGWMWPMWLSLDAQGHPTHDAAKSDANGSGSPRYGDIGPFEYNQSPQPARWMTAEECDSANVGKWRMSWKAVSDDAATTSEGAATYDVRYSSAPITEANWGTASQAGGPVGLPPGYTQLWSVPVVLPTVYMRMKTKDSVGNLAGLSPEISFNPTGECDEGWYGGGGGGGGGCCHEDPLRGPDLSGLRQSGSRGSSVGVGENTILNSAPTGTRGTDLLPIESVQNEAGSHLAHLRAAGQKGTLVDGVKLLIVDHPVGTEAFACGSRAIVGRPSQAIQATTETGADVTAQLNGSGDTFNANDAVAVTIVTSLDALQTPLVIECANGGMRGHAIIVESQSPSGWREVGTVYPRRVSSAMAIDAVPPGTVRLRFTGYATVSSVARVDLEAADATTAWGRLDGARSSSSGDVLSATGAEDTAATALTGADTLVAAFSGPPLGEGVVRSLFLGISATRVTASAASSYAASQRSSAPTQFALYQNVPNPFRGSTTIRCDLPVGRMVRLEVFDASGRRVRTLINHYMPAGRHSVVWNQRDDAGVRLGAGVYFTRLQADTFQDRKKLTLMP